MQHGRDVWALSVLPVWSRHPQLMSWDALRPWEIALPFPGHTAWPTALQPTTPHPPAPHPAADQDIPSCKTTPGAADLLSPLRTQGKREADLFFSCLNEEQGHPEATPDAWADLLTQRASRAAVNQELCSQGQTPRSRGWLRED